MKKQIFTLSLLILWIMPPLSFASQYGGMDPGVLNSQYMKDLRFHEATTRSKNKSAIVQSSSKSETENSSEESNLKNIVFVNNASIPSETLLEVVKDKIDLPMTAENIASIRKSIMKYYQNLGYYSAVAMISSQNNQNGELVIEVNEGSKNSIKIEE